ncbi:MAG: RNA 3'-terminal phosphate cyclase [Phycisphaerae bacterium]|nr:RNA 3'-terminal phosphate cyclase [Phycisphaerae bacterium]
MLTIDGSKGEGGGQILRSSLALSLVTGTPLRIERIRAGRKKPGLMRQHLTAVKAAAAIGAATVDGATIGSQELSFQPNEIVPGEYHFAVGTAGSTTLVLQTVLPALLTATGPSRLILEGGTHNPFAPSFDFLHNTFLPIINRMGPTVVATLERPGFYPAGGGKLSVTIEPAKRLERLDLLERGKVLRQAATAVVAHLPRHIAERELRVIRGKLRWDESCLVVKEVADPRRGPGNVVTIEVESEHVTEVFTEFGRRGVRAETVARNVANQTQAYLAAGVPVGQYLADQLLLPFVLAGGGSFKTMPLTQHSTTNIDVIQAFCNVNVSLQPIDDGQRLVCIESK